MFNTPITAQKNEVFHLRISSVNVAKSAEILEVMKNFIFGAVITLHVLKSWKVFDTARLLIQYTMHYFTKNCCLKLF